MTTWVSERHCNPSASSPEITTSGTESVPSDLPPIWQQRVCRIIKFARLTVSLFNIILFSNLSRVSKVLEEKLSSVGESQNSLTFGHFWLPLVHPKTFKKQNFHVVIKGRVTVEANDVDCCCFMMLNVCSGRGSIPEPKPQTAALCLLWWCVLPHLLDTGWTKWASSVPESTSTRCTTPGHLPNECGKAGRTCRRKTSLFRCLHHQLCVFYVAGCSTK